MELVEVGDGWDGWLSDCVCSEVRLWDGEEWREGTWGIRSVVGVDVRAISQSMSCTAADEAWSSRRHGGIGEERGLRKGLA